ncbi:unknown; predicted coding region [Mycoplasmopsis pulmonis]|uniref:TIGR01906 family membrane protein n=1 Tax=Mycoplasmopsis pulmonis (strain UAB CTIP) TaxID=272635 RepID=Q98QW8_MYCPU|nr:TIGR01906 family membrane protein [Mycoplasmopsis pulmonis]CAC13415.1 unknown; predicted coding region [Mycoplasmopsis pulmonis]
MQNQKSHFYKHKFLKHTATFLNTISLLIITITLISLLSIFFSKWIYNSQVHSLQLESSINEKLKDNGSNLSVTTSQIVGAYSEIIDYLVPFSKKSDLNLTHFPMSKSGVSHFKDVKFLVENLAISGIFFALLFIPLTIYLTLVHRSYSYLKYSFIAILILGLIIGIAIAANFQIAFEYFHKIFFSNSTWRFDGNVDPIIYALPPRFFMSAAILIIVVIFAVHIVYLFIYIILLRKERKRPVISL